MANTCYLCGGPFCRGGGVPTLTPCGPCIGRGASLLAEDVLTILGEPVSLAVSLAVSLVRCAMDGRIHFGTPSAEQLGRYGPGPFQNSHGKRIGTLAIGVNAFRIFREGRGV